MQKKIVAATNPAQPQMHENLGKKSTVVLSSFIKRGHVVLFHYVFTL